MSDVDECWLLVMHGVRIELGELETITYDVSRRMLTLTMKTGMTTITRACSAVDAARVLQKIGDLHA